MSHADAPKTRRSVPRLVAAWLLAGVAAGLVGDVLTLLIELIARLATGPVAAGELGVRGVPWWRVMAAALIGGLVAGLAWRWVRSPRQGLVPVKDAVAGTTLPPGRTLLDALAQLVAVGAGASVGREAAPRQVAAIAGQWIGRRLRLTPCDASALVAASAGAGLAAVYNTPLAGALMALEIFYRVDLRRARNWVAVAGALVVSFVATAVAWPVVGRHPYYRMGHLAWSWSTGACLVATMLACAAAGDAFGSLARLARQRGPVRHHVVFTVPAVMLGVALIALVAPEVTGNGRALMQLSIGPALPVLAVLGVELLAKVVATPLTLLGGVAGGMLTPALSVGAALGALLALGAGHPDAVPASALVGAGVVLAITQHAPVFATAFTIELTAPSPAGVACTIGAVTVAFLLHLGRHRLWDAHRRRHGRPVITREAG